MNSRISVRSALFLLPILIGPLVTPSMGEGQEEHRIRGNEVSVFNLAGAVEVVSGTGSEVVVQVMRGGGDSERLEVDLKEVDGRQALIVRYPSDQVVYPELGRGSKAQIRVRSDGTFFGDGGSFNTRDVEVSGSGGGLEAWADLRISVPENKNIALFLAVGETEVLEVVGDILVDTGSGAVYARGARGEMSIDTGSGSVTVEGFQGDLNIDTGSGRVEISDVDGEDVMVDTGSGSVEASGVTASSFEVDTGSGRVDLQAVSARDVMVDTGSGSVDLELLADVDNLIIDTGAGAVTIWVPSSLGAEVELDTGSGGIDLDLPFEVGEVKRDHVEGTLGDGNGVMRIDTGSGGIRIIGR